MARLIFLRHAHSVANESGLLSGQLPGVSLSKQGKKEAQELVGRLGTLQLDSIRVSPMQRCQETISPWLESRFSSGLKNYELDEQIIEMNYGSWSGRKLTSLSREKMWKEIQQRPSKVQFPEGEKFVAMQKRAVKSIYDALDSKKAGSHLFVSHGDVIKAMVAYLLKMKLDDFQSLVINPASVTVLDYDGDTSRLMAFNDTSTSVSQFISGKKKRKILLGGGSGEKKVSRS